MHHPGERLRHRPLRLIAPCLWVLIPVAILAAPAGAADRTVSVGSFDRVRIDGAFSVRIVTGRSPRAIVSGEARTLERVDLRVDGTTLSLRRSGGIAAPATPVAVVLQTPSLRSATVVGSADVTIDGMKTERVDLSVAGTGRIAVLGLAAEQANASVIGEAGMTLAGRAAHVRLSTNGAGRIDAAGLDVDELAIQMEGPGETLARARYVATVSSSGAGRIVVTGKPKCTVRAPAGSPITCGAP